MEFDIHRTMSGEDAGKTEGRDSLLYTACSRNKVEVATYLVQQGASITQTISSRFQPIIKSIIRQRFRAVGKAPATRSPIGPLFLPTFAFPKASAGLAFIRSSPFQ